MANVESEEETKELLIQKVDVLGCEEPSPKKKCIRSDHSNVSAFTDALGEKEDARKRRNRVNTRNTRERKRLETILEANEEEDINHSNPDHTDTVTAVTTVTAATAATAVAVNKTPEEIEDERKRHKRLKQRELRQRKRLESTLEANEEEIDPDKEDLIKDYTPPRIIEIPSPPPLHIRNQFIQKLIESKQQFRKVCVVCNRLTAPEKIKLIDLSAQSNEAFIERLTLVTLRTDLKVNKIIQNMESNEAFNKQDDSPDVKQTFDWNVPVPKKLIEYYDISSILAQSIFQGCLLSRLGILFDNDSLQPTHLQVCANCHEVIDTGVDSHSRKRDLYAPPVCAIANGLWIGELPVEFDSLTRGE